MNTSIRYLQPNGQEVSTHPTGIAGTQKTMTQTPEINRLLTAAVVNRRFCHLLLTNPLAALAHGYRGEAFRLNAEEVQRLSTIRATSLRDFALQLLVYVEIEEDEAKVYESYAHPAMVAL